MREREALEYIAHVAEVDKAVVGDAPVGQNRREIGEWIESLLGSPCLGIGSNKGRYKHVGRGLAHRTCFGREWFAAEGDCRS